MKTTENELKKILFLSALSKPNFELTTNAFLQLCVIETDKPYNNLLFPCFRNATT